MKNPFKKLMTLLLVFLLFVPAFTVSASEKSALPFSLKAPENVSVTWLEGNDSPTTMSFAYSLTDEMAKFFQDYEKAANEGTLESFLSDYPYEELWAFVQIDWALDDVNDSVSGWHYSQYWDAPVPGASIGMDKDFNYRTSEWDVVECGFDNATESVQTAWIMRGVPDDERWNGNPETKMPGVKDQLRPGQYEYYDDNVHIDFTQHTAYFRARFVVVMRKSYEYGVVDSYAISDWSETCGYGKDVKKAEPLKPGDLPAPEITGLRMTDKEEEGNPVIAYTLTVPEDVRQKATRVSAAYGYLYIETYARVKGDTEWTDITTSDREVKPGERFNSLIYLAKEGQIIPKDTEIELRCRYSCSQPGQDEFFSDWSKTITFGSDEIHNATEPGANEQHGGDSEPVIDPGKPDSCPICHFCSQPLGLCIFIWLAIVLIVIAVVVVIIVVAKKKKNKK